MIKITDDMKERRNKLNKERYERGTKVMMIVLIMMMNMSTIMKKNSGNDTRKETKKRNEKFN